MRSNDAEARALTDGAREFGVVLAHDAVPLLLRFLDLVYDWNRSAGLTSVRRQDAVRLHLLDSLAVEQFLRDRARIADLGSGAGLPGIPIAIVLRSAEVTLVETRRRKCSFLREAVRELGLDNVEVLERDARRMPPLERPFDAAVARAFLPPADLLALAVPLVVAGGRIVVMGARRTAELDALGAERLDVVRRADVCFTLPGGPEQRRVVTFDTRAADSGLRSA